MKTRTTRRTILAGAAAIPALGLPAFAAQAGDDPIFAAIEKHKAAEAAVERCTAASSRLEQILPIDKRRAFDVFDRDNPSLAQTEDSRWTAAQADWWLASDAREDADAELVTVRPTTIAGLAALLDYAVEFEAAGGLWGEVFIENGDPRLRACGKNADAETGGAWVEWKRLAFQHAADAVREIGGLAAGRGALA